MSKLMAFSSQNRLHVLGRNFNFRTKFTIFWKSAFDRGVFMYLQLMVIWNFFFYLVSLLKLSSYEIPRVQTKASGFIRPYAKHLLYVY